MRVKGKCAAERPIRMSVARNKPAAARLTREGKCQWGVNDGLRRRRARGRAVSGGSSHTQPGSVPPCRRPVQHKVLLGHVVQFVKIAQDGPFFQAIGLPLSLASSNRSHGSKCRPDCGGFGEQGR